MGKNKRLTGEARRDQIVAVGLDLARKGHYNRVSRDSIAEQIGVTGQAVQFHFKTMAQLRRAIVRAAIDGRVLEVVAQALLDKDPRAVSADDGLKREALELALAG